jgi:hypothetical protein
MNKGIITMSYAMVECTECSEKFEHHFGWGPDLCPYCRSVDTLEEIELEEES